MNTSEEQALEEKLQNPKRVDELSVSTFLRKTFEILEDGKFSDIVAWNEEGDSIVVKDPVALTREILPVYFKHNKLASFIRQLNMYDFRKRKTQRYEHVFVHHYFRKGRKDLLLKIRRKFAGKAVKSSTKIKADSCVDIEAEKSSLKEENHRLKEKQSKLESHIGMLEVKIYELSMQNSIYFNEIQRKNETEEQLRKMLYSAANGVGIMPTNTLNLQRSNADTSILIGHSLLQNQPNLIEKGGLAQNLDLFSTSLTGLGHINSISDSLQRSRLVSNPFFLDQELNKIVIQTNGQSVQPFKPLPTLFNEINPFGIDGLIQNFNPRMNFDPSNGIKLNLPNYDVFKTQSAMEKKGP